MRTYERLVLGKEIIVINNVEQICNFGALSVFHNWPLLAVVLTTQKETKFVCNEYFLKFIAKHNISFESTMAHELGHQAHDHLLKGLALGGGIMVIPKHEIEADAYAVCMGYRRELLKFLEAFNKEANDPLVSRRIRILKGGLFNRAIEKLTQLVFG